MHNQQETMEQESLVAEAVAEASDAPGKNAAAEPAEAAGAAAEEADAFEQLIRGQYKDAFDERVQKILGARLKKLRQENEALQSRVAAQQEQQCRSAEHLIRSRESVAAVYPTYDPMREAENPVFLRLVQSGVDERTAYEAVHHRELVRCAMAYAAERAVRQTARSIASGARVAENGGGSGAVMSNDPRRLTSDELADIRRRVMGGEKIRF